VSLDDDTDRFDWAAFVLSPEKNWVEHLSRLARRRFPQPARAEAACNAAIERLAADDWALLRGYNGASRPGTYLTVIYKRLLEDYSREVDGRARPPLWLSRAGDLWVRVHRMLCLERFEAQAVIDRFIAAGERTEVQLRGIIREIKARIPTCGQVVGETATVSAGPEILENWSRGDDILMALENEQDRSVLHCLAALLSAQQMPFEDWIESPADARADDLLATLSARAADGFGLTGEERLVLRMHFQDGLKLARIGRRIQLPEHTVRRVYRRALAKVKRGLGDVRGPAPA
jgi:RNA polymerase sigma factor (sigma-70 family)